MKLKDVKWVNPPKYDEISVSALWPKFESDPAVKQYFMDKYPKHKLPERSYFFNVLNTVYEDRVQKMIQHANK